MTIPLIVLAILSAIGGMIGVPAVMGGHHELAAFLEPVFVSSKELLGEHELSHGTEWLLMGISVGVAIFAMIYAYMKYVSKASVPVSDEEERPALSNLSYNKFYIDELYDMIIRKPLDAVSVFFYKVVELSGIDGFVNGLGKGSIEASKGLRLLQTGNVGFYIFIMVISIIAVLVYNFLRI
jgi:NADH-quinone oxidoreductase subunit L